MYELRPLDYAKATATALLLAPVLGAVAAFLAPGRGGGMFFLLIMLLLGMGAGSLVAEAMRRATNGKRGQAMQAIAAGAIVAAAVIRVVLAGIPVEVALQDLAGMVLVGAGVFSAWTRLR